MNIVSVQIVICEIRLKSGDKEKKVKGDLTRDGYKLSYILKKDRVCVGGALLHKVALDITAVANGTIHTFESLSD